ncbi:response regulator transcription factor [candidate division KSB1 bacterium]|nr:response regulator transcription factor [candidate division KSB1 bacterium]
MIKILIADDHPLIREGFKKVVAQEIDMAVVAACQNAVEVLDFIRDGHCDVMVLDIDMPGKNGLDLLKELKARELDSKFLMLSIHPEERFAIRALKAGASGYIMKKSAAEELVAAIRKVHHGGKYVTPALAEKLAFDLETGAALAPHEKLSDREFQVFQLIAAGKTTNEIMKTLSLSLSSVHTYRRRIMEKMNVQSNLEMIRYAMKNNLVD